MVYLLDTNAISDLMRGRLALEEWMGGLNAEDQVITCAIVRGEILFGIAKLQPGRRRRELETAGEQFLETIRCHPVPERAGDFYAELKAKQRRRGLALDENDLWIAATSLALDATLVSRDDDFGRIDGLRVVAVK